MIIESLSEVFEENIKKKVIKKDVIIYGTGTIAKEVYEVLINSKYNVNCFINMNLNYTNEVKGLAKIKRADDNKITSELKEKTTIIISIFNSYADVHTIISQLKKLGFKNIICFTELIDIFENKFKERFYLNKKIDLFKDKEKILHIENIWNDEKSKQLYNSIVKFRLYKDYKYLLAKDSLEEQYLPKDIKKLYNQQNIRFIDCGAFDGDTIKNFLNENKKIDSIIAFEPDMGNYKNLISSIREIKLEHKHSRISAFPCAVYSDTAHLKFNMEGSTGSNISDFGLNIVQCVSIDQCIGDFKPTYIKMDIEGSEYEALLGAKDTIYSSKPNLAICLYHKPNDLYEIPLLINSWNLGYKFYLRMHSYSAFDLVLYAVI